MRRSIPFAALLIVLTGWTAAVQSAQPPVVQLLFDSGKEGYPRYRIPSLLVAPDGAVLAICEGRKDGGGLTGNIDLVVKRSLDQGRTFKPLEVIADDGPHTLGNPCPVVDRKTGVIHLALTRSRGDDTEEEIVDGTSHEKTRVMITTSGDDGKTWTKPIDITNSTKQPEWTWYGTGPGVGIQLANGRLLIPSYHTQPESKIYQSHAIYSDDRGKTWQLGATVGDHTSECQAVERGDGTVYLNARTVKGTKLRTIADSRDGGATWTAAKFDKSLYDSHCQGCVYALPGETKDGRRRWLFSNPAGPGRRDLTVRISYDEGRTWPVAKRLHQGDSQYSSLVLLPDRTIGCLYESWQRGNYRIYFARFTLDWLSDGKDKLARRDP